MLVGDYEVLSVLGRGGMGIVSLARARDGGQVAIKILRNDRPNPGALERFRREARLLEALGEEAGYVPLLDAGDSPQGPFIVMPYLAGGTLRERLHRGPLDLDEAVAIVRALALAVGRAHAKGIIHRDLKPENVLFTADGKPLIADLGIAKHFSDDSPGASQSVSLTRDGVMKGTAGYMSPEQMRDARSAGPPADVFALGAILYECVTSEPAFAEDTLVQLILRVEDGTYTRPSKLRPALPRWIEDAIVAALARDPLQRPADGAAFAALLASPRELAPSAPAPGARARRAALGVLVVAGATLGALWASRTPSSDTVVTDGAASVASVARRRATGDVLPVSSSGPTGPESLVAPSPAPRDSKRPRSFWIHGAWGSTRWIHGQRVDAASLLKDGTLVTGGADSLLRTWNRTGIESGAWNVGAPVRCIGLARDEQELIVGDRTGDVTICRPWKSESHLAVRRVIRGRADAKGPKRPECAVLDVDGSDEGHAVAVWADGVFRRFPIPSKLMSAPLDLEMDPEKVSEVTAASLSVVRTYALVGKDGRGVMGNLHDSQRWSLALPEKVVGVAPRMQGGAAVFQGEQRVFHVALPDQGKPTITPVTPARQVQGVFISSHEDRWGYVTSAGVHIFDDRATEPRFVEVPGQISERAFCGPGRTLLVASDRGSFRLLEGDRLVGEPNPLGRLSSLAVSDDGTLLATGSEDGVVTLWDGGDHPRARLPSAREAIRSVAFSRDRALLAIGTDGSTFILPLDKGAAEASLPAGRALSMNGRSSRVSVSQDFRATFTRDGLDFELARDAVSAQLSSDGRHAAVVTNAAFTLFALEPKPRAVAVRPFAKPLPFRTAQIDPTWSVVATHTDGSDVQLWRTGTGERIATILTQHMYGISGAAFDPKGELYATTGSDRHVLVHRTSDGAKVAELDTGQLLDDHVTSVAFTADGRLLLASSRGILLLCALPR